MRGIAARLRRAARTEQLARLTGEDDIERDGGFGHRAADTDRRGRCPSGWNVAVTRTDAPSTSVHVAAVVVPERSIDQRTLI
jgi:hypothetical protein